MRLAEHRMLPTSYRRRSTVTWGLPPLCRLLHVAHQVARSLRKRNGALRPPVTILKLTGAL